MKMFLKKEVKHSVVYETDDKKAPVKSVYVSKEWLYAQSVSMLIPETIELQVNVQ